MKDGLKTEQFVTDDLSGTTTVIEAAEIGSGGILNVNISGGQCSGTKVSTGFGTITTGSPSAGGKCVQANVATVGAGSTIWVVFPTAFAAAPFCTASYCDTTLGDVAGSPYAAGSVLFTGETAAKKIHWICVGSGRV